jgi:chemotaxis response regulator CheB
MKKQNRNLILPFSVSGTEMNHSMKSIKSKHFLPSMVRRKATPVNMLVYREHAGSATPLRMLELNAVNTNAGVREKEKKRTEKGSVTIDMTEEMINYVSSQEQLADAFAKPLAAPRFKYLRDKIGVRGVGEV